MAREKEPPSFCIVITAPSQQDLAHPHWHQAPCQAVLGNWSESTGVLLSATVAMNRLAEIDPTPSGHIRLGTLTNPANPAIITYVFGRPGSAEGLALEVTFTLFTVYVPPYIDASLGCPLSHRARPEWDHFRWSLGHMIRCWEKG
jgi:hypothetical protein